MRDRRRVTGSAAGAAATWSRPPASSSETARRRVRRCKTFVVFLGPDESGELLEVMAIETDAGALLIIHAQPIRNRYLDLLQGGL